MIDYEVIEQNICDRLNGALSALGVVTVPLPDKEADFKKPILKTRITVGYSDSEFEESQSPSAIIQREKVKLKMQIESKVKRGAGGIYDVLSKNVTILSGFEPENCHKIWFGKTELVHRIEDLTVYSQELFCYTLRVEDVDIEGGTPITTLTATGGPV